MRGWKSYVLVFLGAALVAGLPGCGGSSSPTAPPVTTPTPVPCTQTKVYGDVGFTPARTLIFDNFAVPNNGRLDITLDWTLATSPIGFYLVPVLTCLTVEEFNARTCNFLVRSEPSAAKPKKISLPNFSAGNYTWIVANYSEDIEAANLLINLSTSTCPALTSTTVDASAKYAEDLPKIERVVRK